MSHDCQGACDEHRGAVRRVHVRNAKSGTDWGEFDYCERAIERDTTRGLEVTLPSSKGDDT